jgi:hypothetical protein
MLAIRFSALAALGLAAGCAPAVPRMVAPGSPAAELRVCNDWHSIVRLRLDNRDPFPVPVGTCTKVLVEPAEHALLPEPHLLPADWFATDAWVVTVPPGGTTVRFGTAGGNMLELVRIEAPPGASWERCDWASGRIRPGIRVPYKTSYYAPSNISPRIEREQVLRWVRAALVCQRRGA